MRELGKITSVGIYNLFENHDFVCVGMNADTAKFAVESMKKWRYTEGQSN
jgi:hypothetical protein